MKAKRITAILTALILCAGAVSPAMAAGNEGASLTGSKSKNSFPTKFDLREKGVVTPVKRQNPWGSCWSFGGIAAAETSILSMLGTTNEQWKDQHDGENFDLSEKHLVWFASSPITEETNKDEAGEGLHVVDYEKYKDTDIYKAQDAIYDGGVNTLITNLFANGVGPVHESFFPYYGKNKSMDYDYYVTYDTDTADVKAKKMDLVRHEAEEDLKKLDINSLDEAVQKTLNDKTQTNVLFKDLVENGCLDEKFPDSKKTAEQLVAQLEEAYYAKKIKDLEYTNNYTKQDEDWTIPEHTTVDGETFLSRNVYCGYTLLNGNVLPDPAIRDKDGNYLETNEASINAIKSELSAGRGVSIAFYTDASMPGQAEEPEGYMNLDTWAQYTYDDLTVNHGVCIVGWDDTIPKEMFNDDPAKQPPAGGAWIVKNSWGSETDYITLDTTLADGQTKQTVGRKGWGMEDADGNHTGYFYLSYYDKCIQSAESMEFDTDLLDAAGDMTVWSHSYMPSTTNWKEDVKPTVVKTANVFQNDSDDIARLYGISSQIAGQNATVEYNVYLLNEDAATPEDGTLLYTLTKQYDYAGFHREKLDGSTVILPGEKIAIVVSESTLDANGNKQYTYATNVAVSKKYSDENGYPNYGVAVVNKGDSFLYDEGAWIDWTERYQDTELYQDSFTADNFNIKAYIVYDAGRDAVLPESYDLRNEGVVTPVKKQEPWQTCWAFSAIAASETSILSMLKERGEAINAKDLDLSEKHLAWFAQQPITASVNPEQEGEGMHMVKETGNPNQVYNNGGFDLLVTTLFSAGIGPVIEEAFPYQGATGLTEKQYIDKYPEESKKYVVNLIEKSLGISIDEIIADPESPESKAFLDTYMYESGILDRDAELTAEMLENAFMERYAGKASDAFYAGADDWTIPELNADGSPNRNYTSGYTLLDGNTLPDFFFKDNEGHWASVNPKGIRAVKEELMQGRAVSAGFKADQASPGDVITEGSYINTETWAHYTHRDDKQNHAITIIGWDDNYSKENFNADYMPPADGAWLVKNSWGSETDYVVNESGAEIAKNQWGIVDENGNHTGYFWISYYDKTLNGGETMTYDTDLNKNNETLGVWVYDYMPAVLRVAMDTTEQSESIIKTANVFDNDSGIDMSLHAVSTKSAHPDARVKYSIYKLNENASDPEDGTLLSTKAAYYKYAGFHREKLDDSITVKAGEKIGIVAEEYVIEDGVKLYEYAVNAAPTKKYSEKEGDPFYCVAVVNEGESFVYENGDWIDFTEYEPRTAMSDAYAIDNFSIKAYVTANNDDINDVSGRFTDVKKDAWYHDAVKWAFDNGIMKGMSVNTFEPESNVTRAMVVAMLHRMAGEPEGSEDVNFADTDADAWYGPAVRWAAGEGVVYGYNDTEFGPNDNVTREQLAAILYRYAKAHGKGFDGAWAFPLDFSDAEDVSEYAYEPMCWMTMNGIINGMGDGTLSPYNNATRAQIAVMFMLFSAEIEK